MQSDADAIAANAIPGITAVAAQSTIDAQAVAGAENVGAEIVGTSSNYAEVRDLAVSSGAFFTSLHDEDGDLVATLGARVAETLYPGLDPIGQEVRLSFAGGRITFGFTVIGVLERQGGASAADDQVFVPLSGIAGRFRFLFTPTGSLRVTQIDIQTASGADEERVKEEVSELLLFLHETTEPDFVIQSQDDLISAATEVSDTLSILLGSIAGISLLVGGIGVMNIMLVSVTERTREIGIRRAVGASASDIVKQFVTEALTLSLFGGLVGIAIGIGASLVIDGREIGGQEMTTLIQPWSIAAAFVVAAGVRFASGSYPAYRADRRRSDRRAAQRVSPEPLPHGPMEGSPWWEHAVDGSSSRCWQRPGCLALAACSGSDDSTSAADEDSAAGQTSTPALAGQGPGEGFGGGFPQLDETQIEALSACLEGRDIEVPDGATNLQALFGGGPPSAELQEAVGECATAVGVTLFGGFGGVGGGFGGGAGNREELLECLTAEGLDVDELAPAAGGALGQGGPFAGLDRDDADVQAALEVCAPGFGTGSRGR